MRGNFKVPTEEDAKHFIDIVGVNNVISDFGTSPSSEMLRLNQDWWKQYRGQSKCAVFPTSTLQVSEILKYCHQHNLAVTSQGGNTGVTGGSVPIFDEIILSTAKLNKIIDIQPTSGIVQAEAGVVLEQLDQECSQHNLIVPLDLGAKGSCHIGGNVATNAGGLRLVRYGSLRGSVLSLEVVLADGTILNCGAPLRKDNTGYDMKQLFIGSEGTLGVITKVAINCPPRPTSKQVAVAAVPSYEAVQKAFVEAKTHLNEILSAFEFWDHQSVELVERVLHQNVPLSQSPFYILVETSGSNHDHDMAKLDEYLSVLLSRGICSDGIAAQDEKQATNMWTFRENIPVAWGMDGEHCLCYDLGLPLPHLYRIVEQLRERFQQANEPINHLIGFGHVGDFNLHLNLAMPKFSERGLALVEPFIYDYTERYKGSVSAEHGVGIMKKPYLHYTKTKEEIDLMKKFKKLLDPDGILNPGKLF